MKKWEASKPNGLLLSIHPTTFSGSTLVSFFLLDCLPLFFIHPKLVNLSTCRNMLTTPSTESWETKESSGRVVMWEAVPSQEVGFSASEELIFIEINMLTLIKVVK